MSSDRSWGTPVWRIPGKLPRALGKMSLSRASHKDFTALVRDEEQSDAFLCGHTKERKWQ